MNDDELRAFLGANSDDAKNTPLGEEAQPEAMLENDQDNVASTENDLSFDELLGEAAPSVATQHINEPSAPVDVDPTSGPESAAAEPDPFEVLFGDALSDQGAQPTEQVASSQSLGNWSQTYATGENEELVPLILPGFAPEPQAKAPLPPVFQADSEQKPSVTVPAVEPEPLTESQPASPAGTFTEPEPTAPHPVVPDVIEDTEPIAVTHPAPASSVDQTDEPELSGMNPLAALGFGAGAVAAATANPTPAASATPPRPAAQATSPLSTVEPDPFSQLLAADSGESTDYEKIAVTGAERPKRKALPWLIVGAGVAVALVGSLLVVNSLSGGDADPQPTPTPTPAPMPEPKPEPDADADADAETDPDADQPATSDKPPAVEVGEVWKVDITQWNLSVDVSQRLGGMSYVLEDGNTKAMLSLPLAENLPQSCAGARTGWGLLRDPQTNKLQAIRPEPRCTVPADAAVYDTIWGLVAEMAKSAKPIG